MNKITVFIIMLILLSVGVNAGTEVMKMTECEFALSNTKVNKWKFQGADGAEESTVFKPWNNAAQEGIYLKVVNNNQNLGQVNDFEHIRYTPDVLWFNEHHPTGDGTTTNIPVIDVTNGKHKYPYHRCRFKVGNYRYFIGDSGFASMMYLTNDFDLTTGLIAYNNIPGNTPHYLITHKLGRYGPCSGCVYRNNLHPGESGFFPNTEPYEIMRSNDLAERPSSFVYSTFYLVRDTSKKAHGGVPTVQNFYIKNDRFSMEDIKEDFSWPVVDFTTQMKKDEDTGAVLTGCPSPNKCHDSQDLELIPGNEYTASVDVRNPYDYEINVKGYIRYGMYCWHHVRGVAKSGSDVSLWCYGGTCRENFDFTLAAGESQTVSITREFPDDNTIVAYRPNANVRFYGLSQSNWFDLGTQANPWLTFYSMDPRIGVADISGTMTGVFNITLTIRAEGKSPYQTDGDNGQTVTKDNYELIGKIYHNAVSESNKVYEETIELPNHILPGHNHKLNWIVPISDSWSEGLYIPKFFAKQKTAPYAGQIISTYPDTPVYFNQGELQYRDNADFNFDPEAINYTKEISLFNPDFYPNTLSLEIKELTDGNFTFLYPLTVNLGALEVKNINLTAKAGYTHWPLLGKTESFALEVSSDQQGMPPTKLTYNLNVEGVECGINNVGTLAVSHDGNYCCRGDAITQSWEIYPDNTESEGVPTNIECLDNLDNDCDGIFDCAEQECGGSSGNPDSSVCSCSKNFTLSTYNICDTNGEVGCWSTYSQDLISNGGNCCGDDEGETWLYSTTNLDQFLLTSGTCHEGTWKSIVDIEYYNLDIK